MAGRSEIIAILASGTSFRRFLFPYWLAAGMLATILFFAYRYVLPPANRVFSAFQARYIDAHSMAAQSTAYFTTYFQESANRYVKMEYDTTTKVGVNFFLQKIENDQLIENVQATRLEWDTAKLKWRLTGVLQRQITGLHEKLIHSDTLYIPLNFRPQDIKKDEYTKDKLTTPELKRFIALQQQRGAESINDLLVEEYHRTATPVSVVLLSFIGVSVCQPKSERWYGFPPGNGHYSRC